MPWKWILNLRPNSFKSCICWISQWKIKTYKELQYFVNALAAIAKDIVLEINLKKTEIITQNSFCSFSDFTCCWSISTSDWSLTISSFFFATTFCSASSTQLWIFSSTINFHEKFVFYLVEHFFYKTDWAIIFTQGWHFRRIFIQNYSSNNVNQVTN